MSRHSGRSDSSERFDLYSDEELFQLSRQGALVTTRDGHRQPGSGRDRGDSSRRNLDDGHRDTRSSRGSRGSYRPLTAETTRGARRRGPDEEPRERAEQHDQHANTDSESEPESNNRVFRSCRDGGRDDGSAYTNFTYRSVIDADIFSSRPRREGLARRTRHDSDDDELIIIINDRSQPLTSNQWGSRLFSRDPSPEPTRGAGRLGPRGLMIRAGGRLRDDDRGTARGSTRDTSRGADRDTPRGPDPHRR